MKNTEVSNLKMELQAPIKSFRLTALEKIIRSGKIKDFISELNNLKTTEKDKECLLLIEHALSTLKKGSEAELIKKSFADLAPRKQFAYVRKLPVSEYKKNPSKIRKLLASTKHPVVIAAIMKRFEKIWPDNLLDFAEKAILSDSSLLKLSALEIIIRKDPSRLHNYFEKLVLSSDPLVRATAIRGLAKTNPDCAKDFLADALQKGDDYSRLSSLRVISIMPFSSVKEILFKALHRETNPKLLQIIFAVLLANPDKQIPYRICDLIETSEKDKQKNLCNMLNTYVTTIKDSGIYKDFDKFFEQLKDYHNRIKIKRYIQKCISLYESADFTTKKEIIIQLREKMRDQAFSSLIISEKSRHGSSELLEAVTNSPQANEKKDEDIDEKDPNKEIIKKLFYVKKDNSNDNSSLISKAMSMECPFVLAAAFRAAIDSDDRNWSNKAINSLQSKEEVLIASAIEYLAAFDEQLFLLQTRRFIKSESLVIRTVILKCLSKNHPDDARLLLQNMLNDPDEKVRAKALSGVIHFDFSSVNETLLSFLEKEQNKQLLESCICFFLANPLIENVFKLEQISEKKKEHKNLFQKKIQEFKESLIALQIATEKEITDYLKQKKSSNNKKDTDLSNEKIQHLKSVKNKINWRLKIANTVSEHQYRLKTILKTVAILFFAIMLIVWISSPGKSIADSTESNAVSAPVRSVVSDYVLVVKSIDPDTGTLKGTIEEGKTIIVLPRSGRSFNLRPGDKISLRAMPFRRASDGTLIVRTISIGIIN